MPRTVETYDRLLTMYRGRVASYADVEADFGQRWTRWCRHLLSYGGDLVVPPRQPDEDLDEFLAHGRAHGAASRTVEGGNNACHANAAILWIDGAVTAIGTGYALSDDNLWRQHSWGIDTDGTLVETTIGRQLYVGLTLSGVAALRFAVSNADYHLTAALKAGGPRGRELAGILQAANLERPAA
jgi:hypothetical protein